MLESLHLMSPLLHLFLLSTLTLIRRLLFFAHQQKVFLLKVEAWRDWMLLLTARQGHHQIPRLKRRLLLLSLRLQNLDYLMKSKGSSVLISLLPSRHRHLHWWTNLD